MNTFGEFFKAKRVALGKTLRQFCFENGFDPGNISRIERGVALPPQSEEKLKEYAQCLDIAIGSKEWDDFQDLACVGAGKIPKDLIEKEIVASLPVFFRALKNKKFTKIELDKLIKKIKES